MEAEIPKKIRSAHGVGAGKPIGILESDVPQLGEGEVLVKIAYATINPSDLMALAGHYPTGKDHNDWIPGLEGCGTVVQAGDKVTFAKGTKLGFYSNRKHRLGNTWSEYAVIDVGSAIELPADFDLKLAAGPIVNPLTVHTMIQEMKEKKYSAIVQTAAASALGRMIIRACKANGIKTINIIRKEEQIKLLKDEGGDEVLNSADPNFKDNYKKAVAAHKPGAIFDAIAGDFSVELLRELPQYGTLYIYGALQEIAIKGVTVDLFIFQNKSIQGFHVGEKFQHYGGITKVPEISKVPELLKTQYLTHFGKEYGLHEINEAIADYSKNMTAGKILINPHKK